MKTIKLSIALAIGLLLTLMACTNPTGCQAGNDTLTVSNTITDTVTNTVIDTVKIKPEWKYHKVRYVVESDTGACNVNWITEDSIGVSYFDECAMDKTVFIKDSLNISRVRYARLLVEPDYNDIVRQIQTIKGFLFIDDELVRSDSTFSNGKVIVIGANFR